MGKATPDLFSDPFDERSRKRTRAPLQLLGGRFHFESNSAALLQMIDGAYSGLPAHRLSSKVPRMSVTLHVSAAGSPRAARAQPEALRMFSGAGMVAGATGSSNFVVVNPEQRTALVSAAAQMLRFPYHTRYELIEFAVFTLATRAQRLVPLHAACISKRGRGLVLMGDSGAGKSTVCLLSLMQGFDAVSEDSTFVEPGSMRATGIANFLHVRSDSLRWIADKSDVLAIRRSPVITRRSGVRKFEFDLRSGRFQLAATASRLAHVVFLSASHAVGNQLLVPLPKAEALRRLTAAQPYAAGEPGWREFCRKVTRAGAFELRRGRHPLESVAVLDHLIRLR